ncbi:YFL034W [Zygosaccharomyces parabailii]|uniref:ZYBA0S15-00628g1_1 n=1 Tax=Zygosaccharomyces bailii (strain CLIB 213 / ATCC 58445 / CBS 680 / BCRC 21525 / NBRC 1098 / NCYC 1416 / NRRL Y-2227) TaxID=1333698 RepID=A0A8J2TA57_ZYGB2|nr:YFL034W [Zygosaccharomyces parabailii]CDF91878.1 ZYBA0S15-00628g1_1 [Zygosaccharomyces bailii CLIB 213]CDH13897.1 uncharacterized protein ZBAI_05683 [Zygosaccharomyces bailii ISA1307]
MSSSEEDLGTQLKGLNIVNLGETTKPPESTVGKGSRKNSVDLGSVSYRAYGNDEMTEIHYRDSEGAGGKAAAFDRGDDVEESGSNNDSDSDDGWQTMPAIASYEVYDDKGQLSVCPYEYSDLRSHSQEALASSTSSLFKDKKGDPKSSAKTTFGYTKVAAEEQAQRSLQSNRKTDFLFDHRKLLADSSKGSSNTSRSSNTSDEDKSNGEVDDEATYYDEYEDDVEPMDDLNQDTQLDVTKNLLTEKEKFAYVGAVNVLLNQMCTELATLCLCVDNITSHKKLARRLHVAQRDAAFWKTDILGRLYSHLDLSEDEIKMIEQLSHHGIGLQDLCKCLKTQQNVENPFEGATGETTNASGATGVHLDSKYEEKEKKKDVDAKEREEQAAKKVEVDVAGSSGESLTSSITKRNLEDDNEEKEPYNNIPNEVVNPETIKDKSQIEIDVAWTVICDLFLVLLQDAIYDSRSRILLLRFAQLLNVTNLEVCEFERRVTDSLDMEQSTEDQQWTESQHMKDRRRRRRRKKICYVGLAMVGGSLVLGLSGGLLAPVIGAGIAAGLSTIGITGAAGFLTGAGGATIVAVTSTAIGGKIGLQGMKRRMGSVRTFEFCPLHNNRRVNLLVSVSGWMIGNEDDVRLPYSTVDPVEGDLYSLNWEPEMLKSIGQSITIIANELFTTTIQQVLGATVLTAFISAIQWPMWLSKLSYILDNPWNVSLDRAWSAGLILADTLIARNLGQRPTTLMGFSLGSRVIFSCLVELCKRKAYGLVENVYLFGTPVIKNKEYLVMARSVVSGRFVNAYSSKDWMLAYLFRAAAGGFSTVMGIAPINHVEGIENFDCTDVVDGHLAYRKNMPKLLKRLGIAVVSEKFVEIEEDVDPEEIERKRKLVEDVDAAQRKLSEKKKNNSWMPKWLKPKKSKWRSMVENAVEEGNEIEAPPLPPKEGLEPDPSKEPAPEEPTKPIKKDPTLVDHGALMHELKVIKEAIHEEQRKNEAEAAAAAAAEARTANALGSGISTEDGNIPFKSAPQTPQTPQTPKTTNNFQLLSAGRTILPEDDDMRRGKSRNDMTFEFPDDI